VWQSPANSLGSHTIGCQTSDKSQGGSEGSSLHSSDNAPFQGEVSTIVMEFCDSGSLENYKKENLPTLLRLFSGCLAGLIVVHDKGFVHRDLKPENVFLHRNDNGTLIAKVGDFCLSGEIGANDIVKGNGSLGLGIPFYSSPEQYNGITEDHQM
jgi:serine/threonine protein kinase